MVSSSLAFPFACNACKTSMGADGNDTFRIESNGMETTKRRPNQIIANCYQHNWSPVTGGSVVVVAVAAVVAAAVVGDASERYSN